MRNTARLVLAALVACVAVFGTGAGAQAAPQGDPYPDVVVDVTVSGAEIIGGTPFDFKATSSGVDCDWTVSYPAGDDAKSGSGESISGTFDTPVVNERTNTTVTATCAYNSLAQSGETTTEFATAAFEVPSAEPGNTASDSATVVLLPRGGDTGADSSGAADSSGILPGTGGASLWILVAAVALVLVGGGAVAVSRRRS